MIIQHIRVRCGEAGHAKKSGWSEDSIATIATHNVIIDHCSSTWATDENLSASGPRFTGDTPDDWRKNTSHHITFSNCIIAEGLSNSTHEKGEHSKGSLIHDNTSFICIFANLYASNMERNPLTKGGEPAPLLEGVGSPAKEPPLWPTGLEAMPADKVKEFVAKNAGARPWDRDPIDTRIVRDALQGKGKIINSEQEAGGYPTAAAAHAPFKPEEWNLETMQRK